MQSILMFFLSAAFFVSCAHHKDVRPGAKGIHRIAIQTDDTEKGTRAAIKQAHHFCKKSDLAAAFVEEKLDYVGDMDEDDYKAAKKATAVAQTVGGAVHVFGGKNNRHLGRVIGIGGYAGDQVLGKGYAVQMKFRCI